MAGITGGDGISRSGTRYDGTIIVVSQPSHPCCRDELFEGKNHPGYRRSLQKQISQALISCLDRALQSNSPSKNKPSPQLPLHLPKILKTTIFIRLLASPPTFIAQPQRNRVDRYHWSVIDSKSIIYIVIHSKCKTTTAAIRKDFSSLSSRLSNQKINLSSKEPKKMAHSSLPTILSIMLALLTTKPAFSNNTAPLCTNRQDAASYPTGAITTDNKPRQNCSSSRATSPEKASTAL